MTSGSQGFRLRLSIDQFEGGLAIAIERAEALVGEFLRKNLHLAHSSLFFRLEAGRFAMCPSHRFAAAFFAISARRSGETFFKRAFTMGHRMWILLAT
jgi:hypothetical protein